MISHSSFVIARIVAPLAFWAAVAAAPAEGSDLAIPARNIVDLDEGTVEFWMRLDFDPWAADLDPHGKAYQGWGTVLSVDTGDPIHGSLLDLWLFTKMDRYRNTSFRFRVGLLGMLGKGPGFLPFPKDARAGDWRHCAFTWNRDSWAVFRNGERVAQGKRTMGFDALMHKDAELRLGWAAGRSGRGSLVVIDELRVSSVARKPEDLGNRGRLNADALTTLLLTFDDPAALDVELPPYAGFVEGKFGMGLKLYR
jgi:hypothetical protein